MGPLCVVLFDPGIELGLGLLERGEGAPGEELALQRPVEPLDLAGGRRAPGGREQVAHVVLAADAVEEHEAGSGAEAAGEHLAVVGEDLLGGAVAREGLEERLADRPRGGAPDEPGRDAEARVVVDAADELELTAVGEAHAAHDVHLPELHGALALPAAVVLALAAPLLRVDEAVAQQGSGGSRSDPGTGETSSRAR